MSLVTVTHTFCDGCGGGLEEPESVVRKCFARSTTRRSPFFRYSLSLSFISSIVSPDHRYCAPEPARQTAVHLSSKRSSDARRRPLLRLSRSMPLNSYAVMPECHNCPPEPGRQTAR